jgi:Cytosol aminopeptidase family, catalytic domain
MPKVSGRTDEPVRQLLMEKRYRKQLDSHIADMLSIGRERTDVITAALSLAEFVGHAPWAHVNIADTRYVDANESWRPEGATGFGTHVPGRPRTELHPARIQGLNEDAGAHRSRSRPGFRTDRTSPHRCP